MPANEASADDLEAVLDRGDPTRCRCQWLKVPYANWRALPVPERAARLRDQTRCGEPTAERTTGLIAYLDGAPAGWCAVEPRTAYPRLLTAKVPWVGRQEDRQYGRVWAVTCFVTRAQYRRRDIGRALAGAAVDFARVRGARAVEVYPITADAGTNAERYVGTESMFADAGFVAVSRPSDRRVVMRFDLDS